MKVKMKLDAKAIKDLALQHGEKLAFGIVAVVFVMLVYSTIKREKLDAEKQPGKLQEKSSQVQSHLTQSAFDAQRDGLALVNYVDRAKREQVDAKSYAVDVPLNVPIADPKTQRDVPALFAVEQLRAVGGFGVFALGGDDKPADAQLSSRAYVVITGLVPIRKQLQEYSRAFGGALGEDPKRDQPQYQRLIVQRAEIDPSQPDKLEWQDLPGAQDFVEQWGKKTSEIVDDKQLEPALADPLGPLVSGWGDSVTHPNIHSKAEAAASAEAATKPADGDYRLCRAFDFVANAGKNYRYRVKAVLDNPNHNVLPQYLARPETSASETLETDWCKPTATVGVPDRYGVLAGGVGEHNRSYDPSASVIVTAIDPQQGFEAATEIEVWRGSVVDTEATNVRATDPRNKNVIEIPVVNFTTGIVVVDVYGGKSLTRRVLSAITGPVEILFMDRQGNLLVRNELDDRSEVKTRKPKEEAAERTKRDNDEIPGGR